MNINREANFVAEYDVIVAGGGVAGVAAAVAAKRMGKSVLLIEKSIGLGGLATNGLVNLFVPMCNGRGVQIIKGMAEELLRLSVKYGYDTIPEAWQNGEPGNGERTRYVTKFSGPIFTLALIDFVHGEGVDLLFDTIITAPVMEGNVCRGLIVENKTGCEFYGAKMVIDTTGDADVLYRAGVPTVQGQNYHTYAPKSVTLDSCRKAAEAEDMSKLYGSFIMGGRANLYGGNQPEGKPTRGGTTVKDITEYVIENHIECLENIKDSDRRKRTIVTLPTMPQFRTTRHIDGDYVLQTEDAYKHFDDSIAAICDFDRRDYLYEVPYRTLTRKGFPNLITAGRSAAAAGYAWDVLRVIPPAILTGQAAGVACAMALDDGTGLDNIDICKLQKILESQDVMIHFDDALVPAKEEEDVNAGAEDHI
ncbi:MAG: FAD-dependent oxidoreductase [Lachnospiraceae bacterium]|nr:FAD-dependent oxidoreductase [Lachnospiraceae bacterium]